MGLYQIHFALLDRILKRLTQIVYGQSANHRWIQRSIYQQRQQRSTDFNGDCFVANFFQAMMTSIHIGINLGRLPVVCCLCRCCGGGGCLFLSFFPRSLTQNSRQVLFLVCEHLPVSCFLPVEIAIVPARAVFGRQTGPTGCLSASPMVDIHVRKPKNALIFLIRRRGPSIWRPTLNSRLPKLMIDTALVAVPHESRQSKPLTMETTDET